jgi:hypothetical protein
LILIILEVFCNSKVRHITKPKRDLKASTFDGEGNLVRRSPGCPQVIKTRAENREDLRQV